MEFFSWVASEMVIIASAVGILLEYTVQPVWHQFVYLIDYKENINKLDDELKRLKDIRGGAQLLVDDAERNAQVVGHHVVSWLKNVDQAEKDATELLRNQIGERCLNALNLKLRYSLGKKASKMTQDIIQLLQEGNNYISNRVAFPAPPNKDYVSTSITGFTGLASRISVMEEIMEALKKDDINMIGICGAGGIGKTKMVEGVMGRAKAEKLFEEFAMAVVSQTIDERAIQGQIADKLGLRFDEESVAGQADRLRQRMMKDGKKILVILDDIWEKLDFDKVGLPLGPDNKRCKFIFTTRSEDVCVQMRCQKKVLISYLTKDEAWKLFRESAGSCVEDPLLLPIAEAVADECAGLPLAIIIVGRALEDKVDQNVWINALQQLKKPARSDITGMHKHVFSRIELSYNYLESKEAKSCFLLCCLFPEDFQIPIELLVIYGMGLKLFEDVDTILEARTRVHAFVDKLKRSFLLLDAGEQNFVKMHDVVRDFAISIGSKDEPMLVRCDAGLDEWPHRDSYEHYEHYYRISLRFTERAKFPADGSLQFTNLKLLQLFYNSAPNISGNFFQGMEGLAVLALRSYDHTRLSLPPSLEVLKNLRSLFLDGCSEIEGLSMIGGLEKLEILSVVQSPIRIFPREVGQLKHLKSLRWCECGSIQRMERGTLSCLSRLEELYMLDTFDDYINNEEDREEINACLIELKALSHLKVLAIRIPAYASMAREFPYDNIIKFIIVLSEESVISNWQDRYLRPFENTLLLHEHERSRVFYPLLQKTDNAALVNLMDLEKDLCELDVNGFARLKTFFLSSCEELKYMVDWSRNETQGAVFPQLELLQISDLENLEEICHGQPPSKKSSPEALRSSSSTWLASFGKLGSLTLDGCPKLKYIFSMSIARGLTLLQKLDVSQCNELEVIISKIEEDDETPVNAIGLFPEITDLRLGDLPDLRGFNSISSQNKDVLADKKDTSTHEMEETLKGIVLIFPKLNLLKLKNLPNFTTFSAEGSALALPSLERLSVSKCPKVKTLDHMINTSSSLQLKSTDFTTKPSSAVPKTKTVSDGSGTSMDSYHGLSRWLSCCGSTKTTLPTGRGGPFITNSTDEMNIIQQRDVLNPNEVVLADKKDKSTHEMDKFADQSQRYDQMDMGSSSVLLVITHSIRLSKLKILDIRHCNSLQVIFDSQELNVEKESKVTPILDQLAELTIQDLSMLTHVWKNFTPETQGFQNLGFLHVKNCASLRNLFPLRIAKLLVKLESLRVKDCDMMESIVEKEGMEETLKGIVLIFPKLNLLKLKNLPNFTTFSAEGSSLALPSLERLSVSECPKVKALDHMIDTSSFLQLKSTDFTTKPSSAVPKTKTVSDGIGTSMDSYHGLSRWLSCCGSAKTTLPTGCGGPFITNSTDEMNIIQQRDLLNPNEVDQMMMMSKLVDLSIKDMDNMLYIWTDKIDGSFIPSHLMNRMNNLERMQVRRCKSLETLFDIQRRPKSVDVLPMMNCLKVLILDDLPKLEQIWKNIGHERDFKNLKSLYVGRCDNLKYLFSSHVAELLVELEEISVTECNMMEDIVGKLGIDDQEDQDQQPIHDEKIKSTDQHGGVSGLMMFKKLKNLIIVRCNNFRHPSHIINRMMNNLEKMKVCGCESLETLFDIQRRPKSVDALPMMNCLKELILEDLAKLEQIWKNIGHEGDFKNLKRLDVGGCDNLKYLFSSHVAELLVELEEVRVIRCNMMEEIVGKLGTDDQEDQDQSIHEKIKSTEQHGGRVLGLMFKKLKVLEIWRCHNLRHVFSGSFGTRGLEQLEKLDIYKCKMMEHIVAAGANEENKEEEAKATTSTTTTMMNNKIVFPQLATLDLQKLPRMERFCQGNNYVMELPSLKVLIVDECPMMRDLSEEFSFDYQPMLRVGFRY